MILSESAFRKAVHNIDHFGRDLEKQLMNYFFFSGSQAEVIRALRAYQNEDGGFGRALESDLRMPHSSPIATSVGLRILSELADTEEVSSMRWRAFQYLEHSFLKDEHRWIAANNSANQYPHAIWWEVDQSGRGPIDSSFGNPTAEILGYMLVHRQDTTLPVTELVEEAISLYEQKTEYTSEHEAYCYLHLLDSLKGEQKERLQKALLRAAEQLMVLDPLQWNEYVPLPYRFSKLGISQRAVSESLDHLVRELETKDVLLPPWGEDFYDETMKPAYSEWIGVLTLEALRALKAHGRLAR